MASARARFFVLCSIAASLTGCAHTRTSPRDPGAIVSLGEGWAIQSSVKAGAAGEALSRVGFSTSGWHAAEVPSTVLGTLVRDGVYKDPFFAKNMATITPEPFKTSWWYRKEFTSDAPAKGIHTWLVFEGLNYRADVWLNGKKLADGSSLYGVWRVFEVDITSALRAGTNALAVEVFPSQPGDYIMGFVDWNPAPADRNMGLYRPVKLRRSGSVSVENPFVQSHFPGKTLDEATLTISAELVNRGDQAVSGTVTGEIEGIRFQSAYALAPREKKLVRWSPTEVPALRIARPRVWWPIHLGEPHLYTLRLTATDALSIGGQPSDVRSVRFGIREVGDYINEQGHRGYTVNRQKILIRGGGWVDDLFLRETEKNLEAQLQYVKHMNLNTIRLEGFWGSSDKLYDLADRHGILVMTGFSCQWEWTHYLGKPQLDKTFGAARSGPDADLITAYLRDQVRLLRNHPSVLVWVVGSDKLPWPEVEQRYRADLQALDPTRPYLAAAKNFVSPVSGPTAVKMRGPYNYVTPNFWYQDKDHGGAFGFNTETGPGPQVPPLSSLRRMIPEDKLWPINDFWTFHCAERHFANLDIYMNAFEQRYGGARSVEELAFKAQAANYEAVRPMFEAFGVNRPQATGVVQWMLNGAWPKLYWQLYDYFLMPNGAFYGVRKGSQPHNLVYNYGDHGIYLVNDTLAGVSELAVEVTLLDFESQPVFRKQLKAAAEANASSKLLELPALTAGSPVYFLDLKLRAADGRTISDNFYWLSAKADVSDPPGYRETHMPNTAFADFKALGKLARAKVRVESAFPTPGAVQVTLTNTSDKIAFFLELQVNKEQSKQPVVPIFWDDNYVSLLPQETKTIKARFSPEDLGGENPVFTINGWNLE